MTQICCCVLCAVCVLMFFYLVLCDNRCCFIVGLDAQISCVRCVALRCCCVRLGFNDFRECCWVAVSCAILVDTVVCSMKIHNMNGFFFAILYLPTFPRLGVRVFFTRVSFSIYKRNWLTWIPQWRTATKIYLCKSASHEWISSVAFLFPLCRLPFPIFSRFPIDSVSHFLLGPLVGASVRLSLKSIFSVLWRHCSSQNARLASYIAAPAHPRY